MPRGVWPKGRFQPAAIGGPSRPADSAVITAHAREALGAESALAR
jgi:hypothetical protein